MAQKDRDTGTTGPGRGHGRLCGRGSRPLEAWDLALWQGGEMALDGAARQSSANQRRQWAGQGPEQGTAQALAGDA